MNNISGFDQFALILALLFVMGVIGVKVMTHYLELNMRRHFGDINRIRKDMLREVKAAENEKDLAERNLLSTTTKHEKALKRLGRVQKTVKKIAEEEKRRADLSQG